MIKTIALVVLAIISLTLGGMLWREKQQTVRQSARAAEAETLLAKQQAELQKARSTVADLEQKRAQLAARNKAAKQAAAAALDVASAPTSDASPTPASTDGKKKSAANPFADSIAKMMKDPAMKNMMRTAQAASIKQTYGELVKQWSLSPDEAQTFYDLLLDKQTDLMDQGMNMLEKGPGAVDTPAPRIPTPNSKRRWATTFTSSTRTT